MPGESDLKEKILEKLSTVIDPETGVDVVRMHLIEDLTVNEHGQVWYKFRPSSALCPIAVPLAVMIRSAVASVPGVKAQEMEIVGHVQAAELMKLLNAWIEELKSPQV